MVDILSICREAGREPKPIGGDEYLIQCPNGEHHNNNDEHPSCSVNAEKGCFHCRVCKFGGGYKKLALALGVSLGAVRKADAEFTRRVYERSRVVMSKHEAGRKFLAKRGISLEVAEKAGLGLIPLENDWKGVPAGQWLAIPYGEPGTDGFYLKLRRVA